MIDRTLAHYRIIEKLGEGGMGEVWKAVDTTLDREVAIKILPEAVATDPDRLARFEREAKLLASLNHPNIASVYGLHEADGVRFIAMEYVEGQDLAVRLQQGPLPVDEALEIGRRVAMALEVAHGQGVIHRDLKPANVLLLPNGQVKVLDFGLAKAFTPDAASSGSPTFTATVTSAGTRAGVILGTAAYMSPEQARGKPLDKRTDIWSFGCLLHECLTGESPFSGETVSDSIGAILHKELDWTKLPDAVPPTVRLMLRRCLARDPGQRVHDIADARIELEPAQRDASASIVGLAIDAEAQAGTGRRGLKPWMIAAGVVLGLAVGAMLGIVTRPVPTPAPSMKLDLGATLESMSNGVEAAVSASGGQVVYMQPAGLRVQALNDFESRALDGTEGAIAPVWSPDGSEIAYFSGTKLWKIAATGGRPVALCDLGGPPTGGRGLHWGENDRLFYSRGDSGLFEVSARGGDPSEIVPLEEGEGDLHEPFELPGHQGMLFVAHPQNASPGLLYTVKDGERSLIFSAADGESLHRPVYDPAGFVLFERSRGDATPGVWALPFSAKTLEARGEAFLVSPGADSATVTDDGTLVFVHGNFVQSGDRLLTWVDRQGRQLDPIGGRRNVSEPTLSPDGKRLAFSMLDPESNNLDLWVRNLDRGTETRLTFDPAWDVAPVWSNDGSEIFFLGFRPGITVADLFVQRAPSDGSKPAERLTRGVATDATPDGALLVIRPESDDETASAQTLLRTLHRVPLDGSEESTLIDRPQMIGGARVSPDGSLIAYGSEVSGREEIYLTRYPEATGRWQVSNNGGGSARWDPRGDRLYFVEGDTIVEVMVEMSGGEPRLSLPSPLFDYPRMSGVPTTYTVSADGERFIVPAEAASDQDQSRRLAIRVVTDWRSEFD